MRMGRCPVGFEILNGLLFAGQALPPTFWLKVGFIRQVLLSLFCDVLEQDIQKLIAQFRYRTCQFVKYRFFPANQDTIPDNPF